MNEKGHLQPMVIGREVQNHASFSLVYHDPVSGNELGLNGRSVSAFSAEEVPNEDNCTPTLEVPKKSSQASSDHDARKTSSLMVCYRLRLQVMIHNLLLRYICYILFITQII
jgi:ATP-dependent RNA helicase DHX37/DHR1